MSLNRVIILGNLGQDPELRYTQSGTPVCSFSLATTDVRQDREGNRQEFTEWHRIVVWSKQAEVCAKYLAKGRTALVEGRLQTRSWEDQAGQKRYTTEIIAQNVRFVGGSGQRDTSPSSYPREGTSYNSGNASYGNTNQQNGNGHNSMPQGQDSFASSAPVMEGEPNLDDIPF